MSDNVRPTALPSLLLTNDDGIDAPGLAALFVATEGLGSRRVVAPAGPYSSCGHSITIHKPFAIVRRDENCYAVEGSPADCVRLAIHHLGPDLSWVVSGINSGGNLGHDIYPSGTVAAVREGVIQGKPGIAVSQYLKWERPIDWVRAGHWARGVIQTLLSQTWERGTFWNVNLPHLDSGQPDPEVVFCALDPSPLPLAYRLESEGRLAHYSGDYQRRPRVPGSDIDVCFGGRISVTLVRVL